MHPGRAEAPTAISASVFVAGNSYVMTHISYVNYPVDQVHPDLAKVTVLLAVSVDHVTPGARRDNTVRGRTLHPGLLPRMRHHGTPESQTWFSDVAGWRPLTFWCGSTVSMRPPTASMRRPRSRKWPADRAGAPSRPERKIVRRPGQSGEACAPSRVRSRAGTVHAQGGSVPPVPRNPRLDTR